MTTKRWPRTLLLASMYMMGILGIVASGGGGGSGSDDGENFTCHLVIGDIAPATDGSGDIWIGLLTKSHLGEVNSVVRLSSNGSKQLSFAIGDEVWTLAIANDPLNANKVYVGGFFTGGILRLNEDGSLDGSFVVGSGFDGRVSSIVPAADGSGDIYVGGFFSNYDGTTVSGLVRLNNDGLLDNVFASSASGIESVALATDDPFLGYIYSGGHTDGVARWNNSGTKDVTFNGTGVAYIVTPAADATGAVYVGGGSGSNDGISRHHEDGFPDGSFDNGTGFDAEPGMIVWSIVRADDMTGDIYAGGWFTTYDGTDSNGIVRLNDDGSRDVNFMIGSGFAYNNPGTDPDTFPYSDVRSIARATDGTTDVYVGGGFTHYNGVASNGIARLNSDGSLDTGFAVSNSSEGGICSN